MTATNGKTLRLHMPQWQGGNLEEYHLSSKVLSWLLPASRGPEEIVPVPSPGDSPAPAIEDGILARKALLDQARAARARFRGVSLCVREHAGLEEGEMATAKLHGVELVKGQRWTVRVTAYGTTLTFPFEAEQFARSYADGQAFRLGVEVVELKDCA
ncbi:hypothetical protein [Mesorhizobium sp. M1A.F.Ca.IN.020.03.2.1]|uniref:hypothetical protein n=2 Tax=Mesorhizobium TaxID=68287 RepID=UPI001FE1294C|nr:hypothetical protein [Mesorhizobium sp. M1A.F.Ca.IN.020.03.2.1]